MTLIDRYILKEWFKAFLMSLGAMLGLLLLEDMYSTIPDFIHYNAPLEICLVYYLTSIPSFLPAILPIILLLSLLFALSNLHRNHEIIAMRASGLNLFQITRSLWLAGILLSMMLFYLNAHLVPWSFEESRHIIDSLRFSSQAQNVSAQDVGILTKLTFDNQEENRLWFINRFSEYSFRAFGINVYQKNGQGQELSRIIAQEGYFDDFENHWVFLRGREIFFSPLSHEPIRSLPFQERSFPALTEDPLLIKTLFKKPKDLSLFEIKRLLEKIPSESNPNMHRYEVRYHMILATPMNCLIVIAIAIPFAISRVRVNPMVGLSKATGIFFGYYLVTSLCTLFAEQHLLNPIVAAWMPNLLALGLALYLYRKVL